jgi:hypothetical protein
MRTPQLAAVLGVALPMIGAQAAAADTYCVHAVGSSCAAGAVDEGADLEKAMQDAFNRPGADTIVVGAIDKDPQFVDAAAGDYHLLWSSPAIEAGSSCPSDCAGIPDLDGLTRPIDGNGDGRRSVTWAHTSTATDRLSRMHPPLRPRARATL